MKFITPTDAITDIFPVGKKKKVIKKYHGVTRVANILLTLKFEIIKQTSFTKPLQTKLFAIQNAFIRIFEVH